MSTEPNPIWAYTYRIVPPQAEDQLRGLQDVLDAEQSAAGTRGNTFKGRLVADDRITHVLVLSDSPELDLDVNHRIEAALHALDARYSVTVPMAVLPEPDAP